MRKIYHSPELKKLNDLTLMARTSYVPSQVWYEGQDVSVPQGYDS